MVSVNCCGLNLNAEWFRHLFGFCDPSECCCGCCPALRPRYKRLVDNIYPANPQDGLVKSNMEKLTFYALSSPEKLDRIGEYLAQKVARDLSRHRNGYVILAVDAMDQLLVACHAQSLNLFVESFLKVVQQLLESQDSKMQILATQSFVKFANIEEDTPSYHRRYDFFVSKFSSLCHNNASDLEIRKILRLSGLNGLKGVIRKTVSDDLQVNIWDEIHMDKIVPSLLYNMQDQDVLPHLMPTHDTTHVNGNAALTPFTVAEECLRELMGRATFGNIKSVIRPVLKHLDGHSLWDTNYPHNFASNTFKIIMYSIQSQHSYAVIQILMSHLDDKSRIKFNQQPVSNASTPTDELDSIRVTTRIRTGIVSVLSSIIAIAAAESIGPSVLEIINSLLNHLRNSISKKEQENFDEKSHVNKVIDNSFDSTNSEDEQSFREAVINTLGEFANNLPDFQKIEIMIFIINKSPPITSSSITDTLLQCILLKSLLKVSTKYHTVNMSQAFPSSFLKPLLSMSLSSNANIRLTVQEILHQLLDRHTNLNKLNSLITLTPIPILSMEKAHRQDMMFMKKYGLEIFSSLYQNIYFDNNTVNNYNAIYTTLVLLCVEMNSEETLTELLRLVLAMQDLTLNNQLKPQQNTAIHCLIASFLHLTCYLTAIPALCSHVEHVIKLREEKAPYLLPEYRTDEDFIADNTIIDEQLLFNKSILAEAFRSSGHDTSQLLKPFNFGNVVDSANNINKSGSIDTFKQADVDVISIDSSPGLPRKQPEEGIDFQSFRKILTAPITEELEAREQRRAQIVDRFKRIPFEDLVTNSERNVTTLQYRLREVFSTLNATRMSTTLRSPSMKQKQHQLQHSNTLQHGEEKANELANENDTYKVVNLTTKNPFTQLCTAYINPRAPPLYALDYPDLFVY